MRFSGKVALVTGGGSGIGRAVAQAFAAEGATVVVTGRNRAALDGTVALIESAGGRADAVVADVTSEDGPARAVEAATGRHGGLDIAFNSAGVLAAGPVADLTEDGWATMLAVNVTGVWRSMKHQIGYMREHGGGVIINTCANLGPHMQLAGLAGYGATKAAVRALTRGAALENIGHGIRINAISPGPVDTPMSLRPGETEADRAERVKGTLPIGRVGTLGEVAGTVLWLASPDSGFAVGHDIVIDGGASL